MQYRGPRRRVQFTAVLIPINRRVAIKGSREEGTVKTQTNSEQRAEQHNHSRCGPYDDDPAWGTSAKRHDSPRLRASDGQAAWAGVFFFMKLLVLVLVLVTAVLRSVEVRGSSRLYGLKAHP